MPELGQQFFYNLFLLVVLFAGTGLLGLGAEKIATILGFGNHKKLSYKLDNLYKELETGKEINVKDYLCE
jgi:hypothetical protein